MADKRIYMEYTLSLRNIIGQVVMTDRGISFGTIDIEISRFSEGVYFIDLLANNSRIIRKLIISRDN